jgi:hypothetical protein
MSVPALSGIAFLVVCPAGSAQILCVVLGKAFSLSPGNVGQGPVPGELALLVKLGNPVAFTKFVRQPSLIEIGISSASRPYFLSLGGRSSFFSGVK